MNKEKEITDWMPFIQQNAYKFSNRIQGHDDLVSEGVLALLDALNIYTEDNGNKTGYLRNKIIKGIYNAAIGSSFAVHVPSGSMRLIRDDENYIKELKGINIGYDDIYDLLDSIPCDIIPVEEVLDVKDIVEKYDRDNIAHLYFFEGLNYKEIASKVKISIATVSRHINRIREIVSEKC